MTQREEVARRSVAVPPRPKPSPLQTYDPLWLVAVNVGVIVFMWFRHGGADRIGSQGWLIATGQLTGLLGAAAVLLGLVLSSRAPWVERRYGMDRMIFFHRYVGFAAISLLAVHVVSVTVGYAWDTKISIWDQIVDSYLHYPYVANAVFGFALLLVVGFTSLRVIRGRLAYEHWWVIHLATYVGVALAFGHQTATGSDFVTDRWAMAYWSVLYISVAFLLLGYRWVAPLVLFTRHRFRVVSVHQEGDGVVTVIMGGRDLDRLSAQAGQFFLLRAVSAVSWWKAHPFSLSAPPDGNELRFTIKALGDDTTRLQTVKPGTRFIMEGPYGGFLPFRSSGRKALFIAGGVGITPFRGIIEDVRNPADFALLYRNRTPSDAIFRDDLVALSDNLGFDLQLSFSGSTYNDPRPFDKDRLSAFVPDLAQRDVFVVGSPRLISAARAGLRAAGVPANQIHYESFTF